MNRFTYTIGHSKRSITEFLSILTFYNIEAVVDIRRWPKSRKNPWFNKEELENTLMRVGIKYVWLETLGGYRKFGKDVEDLGIAKCFKSQGFRAYATYILVDDEAKRSLARLESIARKWKSAIMCSERLPWMCHRKIVSDWLTARGMRVLHIIDVDRVVEHRLPSCAKIKEGNLIYE